jgi:CBS domain-containing protein
MSIHSASVREYMTRDPLTFTADMEVMTAMNTLVTRKFSGAPVVDAEGRLVGMLSEKDCLKVALIAGYEGSPGGIVGEYMNKVIEGVSPDISLLEVAGKFVDTPYKRFPVVEGGKLVGQISRSDVLRAINSFY